ncbi:hypothetical protein ACO22_07829, partial [Paracoccidioides brasiliensis]
RFSSPVSRNLTVPGGEGNVSQRGIARAIADCRATTALNPESIVHSNVHDQAPRGIPTSHPRTRNFISLPGRLLGAKTPFQRLIGSIMVLVYRGRYGGYV